MNKLEKMACMRILGLVIEEDIMATQQQKNCTQQMFLADWNYSVRKMHAILQLLVN